MARKRRHGDEFDGLDMDAMNDSNEPGAVYDEAYDEEAYDAAYDTDYADDEYDDEYGDEYADEEGEDDKEGGGFLSTVWGKALIGVIVLLVAALVALLVWRFVIGRDDPMETEDEPLPTMQTATQAPGSIVFAPVEEATQEPTTVPTQEPTAVPEPTATPSPSPTPVPTDTPEPTATPLPIILTNTPTPSPTPTASPTPSPSPTPTPSPKPTATPRVDLAQAETNREAKLRESASSSGKVKKTLKKGEALTIHEVFLDKSEKVWYYVSVNDLDTQGWMRDYVVDVEAELDIPTPTPKATATPKAGEEAAVAAADQPPQPEVKEEITGIGTGKTNRDANVRKIMNGKVVTQLRTGKAVIILDAKLDKNGDLWYEIQVKNSTTRGFVRDYVIKLDKGVDIARPTPTPAPSEDPAAEAEEVETDSAALLDREVVGKAETNRAANVRVAPAAGADVVRQLPKHTALLILDPYTDGKNAWYEVATENGKTYGFVRDYVIDIAEIKENLEAKTYTEPAETEPEQEEAGE